jgi:hypothetical protein
MRRKNTTFGGHFGHSASAFSIGTRRHSDHIRMLYMVWLSSCAVPIRRELRNCLCFNVAELF